MRNKMAVCFLMLINLSTICFDQNDTGIRIFRYNGLDTSNSTKLRIINLAKAGHYNYIQVPFYCFYANGNGTADGSKMRSWMDSANRYKIKLIPEIPCVSASTDTIYYSYLPRAAWSTLYGQGHLNIGKFNKTDPLGVRGYGYPSLASDPTYDSLWVHMIDTLNQASKDTKCTLRYVHILHDEIAENQNILIGGGVFDRMLSLSKFDTAYINARLRAGDSAQTAVGNLLISEIYRRAVTCNSIFCHPKTIIYSDAFDPQFNGKDSDQTCLSKKVGALVNNQMGVGIKNPTTDSNMAMTIPTSHYDTSYTNKVYLPSFLVLLPGLSSAQKIFFKSNVILMPWNYGGINYDSTTFQYYSNAGFKFIFDTGIGDSSGLETTTDSIYSAQSEMQLVADAKKFKSNCLGYEFAYWLDSPSKTDSLLMLKLYNLSK